MQHNLSWLHRTAGVLGVTAAVVALAGCGSDDTSSSPNASTVTVTRSQSAAPIPTGSQPGATEASDQPVAGAPGTSAADPIPRHPTDANVTARDFYGPGAGINAYYFQSPSGNVRCGIGFDDPNIPSGCQALTSVRSSTGLTCRNDEGSKYSVQLISGAAVAKCVNQPFFVGGSGNSDEGTVGGRVLLYGQIVSAGGATCESTSIGISCWGSSVGFTLSRDRNTSYDPGYGQ